MTSYAIMTQIGRNKEAAALATGSPLNITEIAWGDGDRAPSGGETQLLNELGRKGVNGQGVVDDIPNAARFDILIDEDEGPFIIREAGLFDTDGDMIAIVKYDPPVNKPANTVSALLRIQVVFSDLENLVLQVQSTNLFAPQNRKITAGAGMKGGGDLMADIVIEADFADEAEARLGARKDKLMSPFLVRLLFNDLLDGAPEALDTLKELGVGLLQNGDAISTLVAQMSAIQGSLNGIDVSAQVQAEINDLVDGAPAALNTLRELAVELQSNDSDIAALVAQMATLQNTVTNLNIQGKIQAAINNLVNGAPAALNTLRELAQALQSNDSDISGLVSQISGVQTTYNNLVAGAPSNLNTLAELANAIQTQQNRKPQYTLLAQFPSRKYIGTITLSQPATNFDSLMIDAVHTNLGFSQSRHFEFPLALLPFGRVMYAGSDGWGAHWAYTNASTLTHTDEWNSRINRVYGVKY